MIATTKANKSQNIKRPIKILFFIDSLSLGGRERHLVELLKQLTHNPDFYSELVIMRKEIFFKEVLELDLKIHVIERSFIKKDPSVFFKFYKRAKEFKPDIVQVCGNMTAIISIPAKILLKFKLINNQIRNAPSKVPSGKLISKLIFNLADKIIANSAAGLEAYKIAPNNGKVINNGFNLERLNDLRPKRTVRKELNITTKYIIAMVGRFAKDKDYSTFISAANYLAKNQNITFLCIGSGNFEEYKKLVDPVFYKFIKFLPEIKDIESIMNICDIGVLATYTEGIPNTIVEFMALGKPVIVTDGGGSKELVINEENGYLVPPQSPQILAEKIQYLLDNPKIAEKFGSAGHNRIVKHFNIDKMVSEFTRTYQELIYA